MQDLDKATNVSRKKITVNALANYVHLFVELLAGLFLQAFIIRLLGRETYALWPVASACLGFLSLIPMGVGFGAGRFMAHSLSRKAMEETHQIASSLFFAMAGAALLYLGISICVGIFFDDLFTIPAGLEGVGLWVMVLLGLAGAVAMPISVYRGGLVATQQFVAINLIAIAMCLLKLGLIVGLFTLGHKSLVWLAAVNLMLSVAEGLVICGLAKRLVPWQKIRLAYFRWSVLRETTSFSGLVLLNRLFGLLYWQTDYILINKLMDPALATGYAVVATFVQKIQAVVTAGCRVIMPAVASLQAQGDFDRIARMVERANRILVPMAAPAYLFLILFGEEVLTLYVGRQYADFAGLFYLLAGYEILWATQQASRQVLHGLGKLGLYVPAHIFFALVNLGLSLLFVKVAGWGLYGLAAGTAIAEIMVGPVFLNLYVGHLLKQPLGLQLVRTVLVPLAHCLPVTVVMFLFKFWEHRVSWGALVFIAAVSMLLHGLWLMVKGLPVQERMLFKRFFHLHAFNRA